MRKSTRVCVGVFFCIVALAGAGAAPLLAQGVKVTSAVPNSAAQGTVSLNVVVNGSGFKRGAKAIWYISGTTNPDGVTVNSTAFNSGSQLTANITVNDTATIGNFDIVVQNANGRTGKGTGLFAVTSAGDPQGGGCTTLGTPSGWNLVSKLNYVNASGAPQYGPALGVGIRVRPVVLTAGTQSRTVLVAAVATTVSTGMLEIYFLDPATGDVLDGTVIVGTHVQPHISVNTGVGALILEAGDVDGNGIPDFVRGAPVYKEAIVVMGHEDSDGIVSYSMVTIAKPAKAPKNFGTGVALGNFDGLSGQDVVVAGEGGGGNSKRGTPGEVYFFRFNGSTTSPGFSLIGSLTDPLPNPDDNDLFGHRIATGDVTGSGAPSLIVGAPGTIVNGLKGAGRVFVFPAPLSASPTYYTLTAPAVSTEHLGWQVGSGVLSSSTATDVVAASDSSSSAINVSIFSGPIASNRTTPNLTFQPYTGLATGWATNFDVGDMNGDGWTDVVVGAPDAAATASCNNSTGAAHLYLSTVSGSGPQWTLTVFQPPVVQTDFMGFGYGVAAVPAVPGVIGSTPLLLVGEKGADLGGVTGAGQVYVYKQQ